MNDLPGGYMRATFPVDGNKWITILVPRGRGIAILSMHDLEILLDALDEEEEEDTCDDA